MDLDQATGLATEASHRLAAGETALAAARRGLDLLGDGSVLVGEPAADWVDVVRVEVAALLRALRHRFAEAALASGDPSAAEKRSPTSPRWPNKATARALHIAEPVTGVFAPRSPTSHPAGGVRGTTTGCEVEG